MEDPHWLVLFRLFTAVRTLQISRELQPVIVPALQEFTGERTMQVLPVLDSLYLEEYQPSGSDQQAHRAIHRCAPVFHSPCRCPLLGRTRITRYPNRWVAISVLHPFIPLVPGAVDYYSTPVFFVL